MKAKVDEYFTGLRGKKIAVLGLGVSNRPLVRLLLEYGCDVTGCDRTPRQTLEEEVLELERRGCKLRVGPDYLEALEADVVSCVGQRNTLLTSIRISTMIYDNLRAACAVIILH